MDWFSRWWRQSDHYGRLSAHLMTRGLEPLMRGTTGGIAAALAVMSIATLWIPGGPRGELAQGCAVAACLGASFGALLWARSWPTRKQATVFVLVSGSSIALVAVAQSDPVVAVLTLTPLAMLASYVALFHAAWVMAFNLSLAVASGAVEAVRIAEQRNAIAATCAFALLVLLNLAVPFGVQMVVHVLGSDAVLAERDQLTGLLTRRAFRRCAVACLQRASRQQAYVVVSVIDLDRFKLLNDSYGHSAGDDALAAVSRAIREASGDSAVIGRSGGEEFVIADICDPDGVSRKAQQLCEVIAALPFGITASVGTSGFHPARRTGDADELLVELTMAADAAMYAAKRSGGNQASNHEWPLPPSLPSYPADSPAFGKDELTA